MPVLANARWEQFAKDLALGVTQRQAYKSSGFKGKDPDSAASRLAKNEQVAARVKELKRRATERELSKVIAKTAITKEYLMEQLLDNAELAKQSGAWGPRNRAIELMGKEIGMFGDQPPPEAPKTLEDLPTSVLEQILRESAQPDDPKEPIQ